MKKASVNYLALMIATAFVASGCNGLEKMAQNADKIERSVTPNPLEMHAGKVPLSITVSFPAKYFDKKAYLVCTPKLKSNTSSDSLSMRSATLQGSKIKDNNPVIDYKTGGTYTYKDTVDYKDVFRNCDLELAIVGKKGEDMAGIAKVKIGDGIIDSPLLVEKGMMVDNGLNSSDSKPATGQTVDSKIAKPTSTEKTADMKLFYDIQKAELANKEQKKGDVTDFVNSVKDIAADKTNEIKAIQIASYASPDGPEDMNSKLAEGRGKSSINFVQKQLKKVEGANGDIIQRTTTQAEDWDGFKKEAEASSIKDKDLILRVLSMYSDPDVREREIKNISAAYTELKDDVLPKLRRSEVKAVYKAAEKSESEIADLAKSNPDELTQEEALYASTAVKDDAAKENVLKNYVSRFPQDWRGFNNLGNYYLQNGDLAKAEENLNKAHELNANEGAVYNNLGCLAMAQGDDAKAKEYFTKAQNMGASEAAGYNLGVLNIKDAEYAKAVTNFGDKASFNKALAQMLSGSATDALATLDKVESDNAWVDYLKAVASSRLGKESDVISNLSNAIKKEKACKEYAKNDAEFVKYREISSFTSLVD